MIKNYLIYGFFSLLSAGIGFVMTPILSHYLTKEDFGKIGLFLMATQFFTPVLGLSMNSIISKSFYTRDDLDSLLGSSVLLISLVTVLIYLILNIIPEHIFGIFGYSTNLLLLSVVASFFMINSSTFLTVIQMEERAAKWGLASISGTLSIVFVTFFLILNYEMGFMARIYGVLISSLIITVTSYSFIRSRLALTYRVNIDHFKYFIRIGSSLILVALGGWAMNSVDRFIIQDIVGIEAMGLYVFAVTLSSPSMLLQTIHARVWAPRAYKFLSRDNHVKVFNELILSFLGYIVIGVLVSVVGVYIYKIVVDENFYDAFPLIPWLIAGIVVQGFRNLSLPFIMHAGHTSVIAYASIIGVIIITTMNYLLIPILGLNGAAISFVSTQIFLSLFYLFYINKLYGFVSR